MSDLTWNPDTSPRTTDYRRNYSGVGRVVYLGTSDSTAGINASDANDGGDPRYPVSTLAQALSLCVANRGDVIYGLPNHAQSIAAAATIAVAGVKLIGLGEGTQRPTFTFTTATSSKYTIGSSSIGGIEIENVRFVCNFDNQVTLLTVDGANCKVSKCELVMFTSTKYAWAAITTTANANNLEVTDSRIIGHGAGTFGAIDDTTTRAIVIVAGDNIKVERCYISGRWVAAGGAIDVTTATTNLRVLDCDIQCWTTGSTVGVVDTATGSTGLIHNNRFLIDTNNDPISGATFVWGVNWTTDGPGVAMVAVAT